MPEGKPRKIEIREFLYPGHHDELLRVLHEHSRKAGNQLVLSISEACLPIWALNVSDYEPPSDKLLERTRVKFTIREDRHPNLFRLYRSIGLGSKGQIFLNLFNRHQIQRAVNFEGVNAAVTKMHERQLGLEAENGTGEIHIPAAEKTSAVESGPAPVLKSEVVLPMVEQEPANSQPNQAQSSVVMADPLAEMPMISF